MACKAVKLYYSCPVDLFSVNVIAQVRRLPGREAGRVQLQTPRLLPELRRKTDGRDGRTARGRRPAAAACSPPMGAVAAVCTALPAGDTARGHHAGARYRLSSTHLIHKAGLTRASAATGAVTLIRRFGGALNLNVHFHLVVLDGVYRREGEGRLRFVPVPSPSTEELKGLVQRIAERIGRSLERSGLITRDIDNAYLAFDPGEEAPIHGLLGSSITYRIATGPREGQKVFTLQTLPAEPDAPRPEVAESSGFSLHVARPDRLNSRSPGS